MTDAVSILRDRLSKAESRAAKAEKAWESARTELSDLQTALRVMLAITGESSANANGVVSSSMAVSERQKLITDLLGVGHENAKAPSDVFDTYTVFASEEISIDTFRTTIWRMKGNPYTLKTGLWVVKGDNGLYWREPASFEATRSLSGKDTSVDEDDSDIPF